MSYSAALTRVRCEIDRQAPRELAAAPMELLEKARAKLESVLAAGGIAFYNLYPERLEACWAALRATPLQGADAGMAQEVMPTPLANEPSVHLTLGSGAPDLPGLMVGVGLDEKTLLEISVTGSREVVQEWRWEWFKLWALRHAKELGIEAQVNTAQLYGAYYKLRTETNPGVQKVGAAIKAPAASSAGRAFSVVGNKQRAEIGVVIRDVAELRLPESRDAMLQLIGQAAKQLSVDGIEYRLLKKDLLAALQSASDGPEGLGLELPLTLLAAVGQPKQAALRGYPGEGRLSFVLSDDKMTARIANFSDAYYGDTAAPVTLEWIQNELQRFYLLHPMATDVAATLQDAIKQQEDLNGVTALTGVPAIPPTKPYLHFSYRDAEGRQAGDLEEGKLDIRELQQRATVVAGQLIAELRFKEAAVPGRNVYDEECQAAPGELPVIGLGEGVQARGPLHFYATKEGIPLCTLSSLALTQTFVLEGDVNLRSGDIDFTGPVEITGSIDAGASVTTQSDLLVHGSILGARLRVNGSITARSGIVTGPTGLVYAHGDIHADFIENSNVVCHGDLIVQKALLNSQVYVGGSIKILAPGAVLAGGKVFSCGSLMTPNLGTKNGAMTWLNIGVDWRTARSVEIRQLRVERLQKKAQEDRLVLRDLVQKKAAQMTPRHHAMKEEVQERLVRIRAICEKLDAVITAKQAELTYKSDARILVRETLFSTNISIKLSGQTIAVTTDVAGVAVTSKRRRGSFIVPIEEILKDDGVDASAPEGKPRRAG